MFRPVCIANAGSSVTEPSRSCGGRSAEMALCALASVAARRTTAAQRPPISRRMVAPASFSSAGPIRPASSGWTTKVLPADALVSNLQSNARLHRYLVGPSADVPSVDAGTPIAEHPSRVPIQQQRRQQGGIHQPVKLLAISSWFPYPPDNGRTTAGIQSPVAPGEQA